MSKKEWDELNQAIIGCENCDRLREYCRDIGLKKRKAYLDWDYWAGPVPNFGDPRADLLIIGLAPGAHGANRTGRMFTGDRSGDWLYRALSRAGFANQAHSVSRTDGMQLRSCAITAVCHCAPPDNKPTRDEVESCQPFLDQTIAMLEPPAILALGQIAWKATIQHAKRNGLYEGKMPSFGHGEQFQLSEDRLLIGSYHPSQQNTFTGRLTEPMFDNVFSAVNHWLAR